MALDPNIALGVRLPQIEGPAQQYQNMLALQNAQRQSQVGELQYSNMLRDQRTQEQLSQDLQGVDMNTPEGLRQIQNAYLKARNPEAASKFITADLERRVKLGTLDKQTLEMNATRAEQLSAGLAPLAAQIQQGRPVTHDQVFEIGNRLQASGLLPSGWQQSVPQNAMQLTSYIQNVVNETEKGRKALEPFLPKPQAVGGDILNFAPQSPDFLKPLGTVSAAPVRPTGDLAMYEAAVARGYKGTPLDFLREKAAAGRPLRPEAAPRTQQVTMSDGGLGIVNMDTGVITPSTMGGAPVKGKPSAFAEKTALQRAQMGKDLTFAITQLTDITKDGGLIDQSTGSGAGRLTDVAARFVGQALPGDIAIGKIAPIADLALKMVPRFEGPQSNADTKSYNEAAGQLKDSSLPTKIRKEAGKVVLRIMQARKNQFVTSDMAAEGAPAIGVDASNPLLK